MEDLKYFGVSTSVLSRYVCFGDGFENCKVQDCKIRDNCKRAYEHCPPPTIIKIRESDQPYAACDHCNRISKSDRYQYKGTTWCEACLEIELGVTMDEIGYQDGEN